jgi:hypothetical protein
MDNHDATTSNDQLDNHGGFSDKDAEFLGFPPDNLTSPENHLVITTKIKFPTPEVLPGTGELICFLKEQYSTMSFAQFLMKDSVRVALRTFIAINGGWRPVLMRTTSR